MFSLDSLISYNNNNNFLIFELINFSIVTSKYFNTIEN